MTIDENLRPHATVFEDWRYLLPQPISAMHKRRIEQTDAVGRLQSALAQVEVTLEFLASLALADLFASGVEPLDGTLRARVRLLQNAGAGRLLALIDACAGDLLGAGRRPFVTMLETFVDRASRLRAATDRLVEVRNTVTHEFRHPTAARAEGELTKLKDDLEAFETGIADMLRGYLLAWIDRVEQPSPGTYSILLHPLRGGTRSGDPISLDASASPITGTPLLVAPSHDEYLTLAPLAHWAAPPDGDHRCFVLSALRGEGMARFSYRDPLSMELRTMSASLLESVLRGCQIPPEAERPSRVPFQLSDSSRGRLAPSFGGPSFLGEQYEFHSLLGRGASGEVWAAHSRVRRQPCAVKVLHPMYRGDATFRERFQREYRVLSKIQHEGIVRCFHYGLSGDGAPYIELERVEGVSLAEHLVARGPMHPPEAVAFIVALLDAVGFAHEHGVLHRDITPRNILCRPGPRPYLIDFGIARRIDGTTLTRHGAAVGSDAYAAPEQLRGERSEYRSDLYSVGRVLLALLRGRELFVDERIGRGDEIPEALTEVILRATASNPTQRFGTAAELRRALLAASVESPPVQAPITETPLSTQTIERALRLKQWFDDQLRPFLEQHDQADRAVELGRRADRIVGLSRECEEEQTLCFLGHAGVGKSTLINALVAGAQTLLPHGGVGPLTAQATSVRSAEIPSLRAEYFGADVLNQLIFSLEQQISRGTAQFDGADSTESEGRGEPLRKQALLLVTGTQYVIDRPAPTHQYLADALRKAIGSPPRWNEAILQEDEERIARIRECIELTREQKAYERIGQMEHRAFLREISTHATGHLAPMIRRLDVGFPSKYLPRGVTLVDLPGVGVAGDVHREIANEWVRGVARAIVLVVDRAGVTEAVAKLLQEAGFLARLHHMADQPGSDPVSLLVVMVKADEVATASRQRDVDEHGKEGARPWSEHLDEVRRNAAGVMRDQLRTELRKIVTVEDDGAMRDDRLRLFDELLERVEVHTVTATQYRALFDDDDERPKIRDAAESGVPGLSRSIERIAMDRRRALDARARSELWEFAGDLRAEIDMRRQSWEEDRRAQEEVERLREALETFLVSIRSQLDVRRGAFREYLRNTAPLAVETRVKDASAEAEKQIRIFLRNLKVSEWHHRTLQAAVKRGGTFHGSRRVAFPDDFTERVEAQVALVWSSQLLKYLRAETRALADVYVASVEEIVTWARSQGSRARPQAMERLQEQLRGDVRSLTAVGNDAIDELKKRVLKELRKVIASAIEERCQRFVKDGENLGGGVKQRILELLFDELVPSAVAAARNRAEELLKEQFAIVAEEVTTALRRLPDPVEETRKLVLVQAERQALRELARMRDEVLAKLDGIAANMPQTDN